MGEYLLERKQCILALRQEASNDQLYRVLICATGSVAAIKLEELVSQFTRELHLDTSHKKVSVVVALTQGAKNFVDVDRLVTEYGVRCFTDEDEWSVWKQKGDPVTHIELRKWADLLLIAPLDANSLAKISNGICDNLVTCVCRAWDIGMKPWIVAPAMNTLMWTHPFTAKQLNILQSDLHVSIIEPVSKVLVCGDQGVGAMASVDDIVSSVKTVILNSETS